MKTFLVAVFLLLLISCGNDPVSHTWKQSTDTIFLKRVLKDTPYHFYNAIYIDTTSFVNNEETITDFSFGHFDSTTYFDELKNLQPLKKNNHLPGGFSKRWILLYKYKNEYYTYVPSEKGERFWFEITDSTTVEYSMEGTEPSRINKITQLTPRKILINRDNMWQGKTVTINLIDPDRGIAIFTFGPTKYREDEYKFLMVSVDKAHKFRTIINYCETDKMPEFEFDEIDFKKLEQQKKP
jgi:hypothetical protein